MNKKNLLLFSDEAFNAVAMAPLVDVLLTNTAATLLSALVGPILTAVFNYDLSPLTALLQICIKF